MNYLNNGRLYFFQLIDCKATTAMGPNQDT